MSPQDKDLVNMRRIAKAMLLAIEHRGKDATGFAFRDGNGAFQVHKDNIEASKFVKSRLCLPRAATTFIAHTRFATQGSELFNENNHPILTAGVVGVHNGHISNDYHLFWDLDKDLGCKGTETVRIGEVDSEAVFALLGFSSGPVTKLLEEVEGGAAIAWMNEADEAEILHLARLNSSPLIIGETTSGSLFFASTQEAVEEAAKVARLELQMIRDIPEGTYMQVLDGQYIDVRDFKPAKSWYSTRRYTPIASSTRGITDRMTPDFEDWSETDDFFLPDAHPNMTQSERTYAYIMGKELDAQKSNVTSLTDRLAQEEPEVTADVTIESMTAEEYEEWWELNMAALDAAIDSDEDIAENESATRRRHKEFGEYCDAPHLNSYYLSNIEYPIEVPKRADYLSVKRHRDRDRLVDEWMSCLKSSPDNRIKAALNLKADAIPGMPVTTDIDGIEVFGHLLSVPSSFPSGDYILRAYLPRAKRKLGFEAVYIARAYHEFELAGNGEPMKGTDLVKVTNEVKLPAQQAVRVEA